MSETASVFFEKGKLKDEFALFLKECPVCGNKKFKHLFKYDGFHYYKCKNCTFVFVNPRTNDKGCYIWYNSNYYDAALETEWFINRQKDPYYSVSLNKKHFGIAFNILRKQEINKNISILDLGCGGGAFLAYLKDKLDFNNIMGVDLNAKAVDFATKYRKLNVQNIDVNHLSKESKFELIISTENIEHVNDVNAYMNTVTNLTKNDGYLLLTTPHNDKWATKLRGIHGDHYCAPNHLNFFNKKSLPLLLKKYGFKIIELYLDEINTQFDLYSFLNSFLRSRLFTKDQVTCFPPYEAYFNKPIFRFKRNRRNNVKIRKILLNNFHSDKTIINEKTGLKRNVRKLLRKLSPKLNIRFQSHIILLAQKSDNGIK